ncbi:hypothetical protein F7725_018725 [Dissostichus mawsoni]|uniref:Uncharacterized protein n=1 Tax=Dissostichus mawsoni TaxID=36200 RepID=A0A7J5XV48_DISMA|nr:hypothetical protein F7725_018725 [Dissostichus mawsoni]
MGFASLTSPSQSLCTAAGRGSRHTLTHTLFPAPLPYFLEGKRRVAGKSKTRYPARRAVQQAAPSPDKSQPQWRRMRGKKHRLSIPEANKKLIKSTQRLENKLITCRPLAVGRVTEFILHGKFHPNYAHKVLTYVLPLKSACTQREHQYGPHTYSHTNRDTQAHISPRRSHMDSLGASLSPPVH